jgi:aminoglycoside 2''-phosphotransferase
MQNNKFLEKIKREFPRLEWQSVKKTEGNWDFDVFLLDEKYVFRFAKDKEGMEKLAREIKLLNYLKKKSPLAVPGYIFLSRNGEFAGYEMIKGNELKNDTFKKLSSKEKKYMAKQIADFLNVLHQTPKRVIEKVGVKAEDEIEKVEKLLGRMKRDVFSKIKKAEAEDIENFLAEFREMLKNPTEKVLVHGDLTQDNLLFCGGRFSGAIDFGDLHIDDPAIDFKGFYRFGKDFVKEIYRNYYNHHDKIFLERVKLYRRIIGIYVLDGAVNYRHSPIDFKEGYRIFKEVFYS